MNQSLKMSVQDWQRIKDLFALAKEQPAERRGDFLREACGDDFALRAEVESLLAAGDKSVLLIERNNYGLASIFEATQATPDYAGKLFGRYKVVREIGRGGMGAVFLAERSDGEFKQNVALKIVRRSFADSELARRFRQERQILASLNHPNIARLLDGGVSADGEPFLAMEYVEGTRIDDYCDERRLSIDERLKLFLAVCRGVQFAHQHLIVHRDIKPSNILVNAEGVPVLLDFGIAKLLDAEHADEQTETNFRAFTPLYASPEQVRGERVTTASDVYSLGVLLDDLMHGARSSSKQRPAAGGLWRSETPPRETAETNLPTNQDGANGRPQAFTHKPVGAELKNIISMARRAEAGRRYPTVAQLADDIQRYLDGLPVRAQKDSFTYRAGKFVRRNKATLGASALVALSLVVGFAVAIWQANVARQERDRAERRFDDVRKLSNSLLFELSPKIERLPGATEAREILVTRALEYLDGLAQESGDDAQLQSELASAYEKVGDLQGNPSNPNVGDLSGAMASYEKAQMIRRRLLEKNPADAEARRSLAANQMSLGDIRWRASEFEESAKHTEAALDFYEKLLSEKPDSRELRFAFAQTNFQLGRTRAQAQKFAEALPYFHKALALLEELKPSDPDNTDVLKLVADCHSQLGNAFSWESRQSEAEAEMSKALSIYEQLIARHPNDVLLLTGFWQTLMQTSSVYEEVNDKLSDEYAQKALRTIQTIVDKDAADMRSRQRLARTLSRLGQTSTSIGEPDRAASYLERAVSELTLLLRRDPKSGETSDALGRALLRLGDAKFKQRDLSGALATFAEADRIFVERAAANAKDTHSLRMSALASQSIAQIHEELAKTASVRNRPAHLQSARESYRRALNILLELQKQNALSDYDRKFLEELQAALKKYE